jgi:hypothetical protein
VIRAGQPLGLLAYYLLEPESDDGFQSVLGDRFAAGREFPVLRVTVPATLSTTAVR